MRNFKRSCMAILAASFVLTGLSACFHEECHMEPGTCHDEAYNCRDYCHDEAFNCQPGCNRWAMACEECDRSGCWAVPCYEYCAEEVEFCDYRQVCEQVCDYRQVCTEDVEVCEILEYCYDDVDCPYGYVCGLDGYCH